MDIALLIWLCFLTILSLIFSSIHISHFLSLWKYRNLLYVKKRKPTLVLLYTVLTLSILLIVIPNNCISIYLCNEYENQQSQIYYFVTESIYDSIFCAFIIIIALRVWLLFYDHKFANATVDRNWRNVISPNESNFFLNKKNSFGSDTVLLKCVFPIYIAIIFMLLLYIYYTYIINNVLISSNKTTTLIDEYLFVSLRICIGLPVSAFVLFIVEKIKNINDQFNITNEMKYLSYMLCYILCTSILSLILLLTSIYTTKMFESILYFIDITFIFSTSYLQTGWVLNGLLLNLQKLEQRRISIINHNKNGKKKIPLLDVLRHQTSFEAFMRHCVNELSVESVLFLVEVAQYKASLSSYNVPDRLSQFFSINVRQRNIRQILICSRKQRNASFGAQNGIEYSRLYMSDSANRRNTLFKKFQQSILERDWIPIAWHLRPFNYFNESLSESMLPAMSPISDATKTYRDLRISMVHRKASQIAVPQSPATLSGTPRTTSVSYSTQRLSALHINTPRTCSVSSEWIRDFAFFLYDKYVKQNSDLSVNVSSDTRNFLIHLFEKDSDEFFEYIVRHSGGATDETVQCPAAINKYLLINTYLYHIFDTAFEEIWNLTRENSFLRFTFTDSYKKLLKDIV